MSSTDEADLKELQVHIGAIVIAWGWAESSLAHIIEMIDSNLWAAVADRDGLPVSLSRRLRTFRLAFTLVPALREFNIRGIHLADQFAILKVARETIVHGAAHRSGPNRFGFFINRSKGRRLSHDATHLTLEQMRVLAGDINGLALEVDTLLYAIAPMFGFTP